MFSMALDDMSDLELNEPMPLPGAGLSGPRFGPGSVELAKRRASMEALLVNGVSDENIVRAMSAEHGMTEDEVVVLQKAVAERMLSECEVRKPFKKAMAERRIHSHIAKAANRNAWGAVANLESQLARIQGTEEAQETKLTVNARLQTATLHVLTSMPQEQVDELIAEELARNALPSKVG